MKKIIHLLIQKIKKSSIFFRIIIIYFTSSIFLLLLLSSFLTYFLSRNIIKNETNASNHSMEQANNTINYILSDIYTSFYNLFSSSEISNILYSYKITPNDYQQISQISNKASVLSECVDSFYIINNKAGFVYSYIDGTPKYSTVNGFFDTQALDILNIISKNNEYLFYSRVLNFSVENEEFKKNYITFAFSLDNGGVFSPGGIVINIDQQKLQYLLNISAYKNYFFIVNANASIIFCSDNKKINTSFLNTDVNRSIYNYIYNSNKENETFEKKVDNRLYFISYKKSPKFKFTLIYIIPFNEIYKQISTIKNLIIIITFFLIFLTFIIATMCSKLIYLPISRLVINVQRNFGKIHQKDEQGILFNKNEFEYLSVIYKQLIDEIKEINSYIKGVEDSKNREIILKFLNNESFGLNEFLKLLKSQNIDFDYQYFAVVVFNLDRYPHVKNIQVDDLFLAKFAIHNIASELISEKFKAVGVIDQKQYVSFILNIRENEANEENLAPIVNNIISIIFKYINIRVSAGIGSFVKNLSNIPQSYSNAIIASDYLFLKNEMSIISFKEIEYINNLNGYEYFYDLENLILNAVRNRNMDQALNNMHTFFKKIAQTNINNMRLSIMQLFISLNRIIKSSDNFDKIIDFSEFNLQIDRGRYLFEVENIFCDFIEYYIKNKNAALLEERRLQMERACEFIKQNYSNPNLSINDIAEYLELSPSYFRTLFKNSFSISPIDYLTNYRMEVAKKLLETTDLPVKDISNKVGYINCRYFYGIFKNKFGVTATEYRKNTLHNE
jgi:AraC-like DNA-binding protein